MVCVASAVKAFSLLMGTAHAGLSVAPLLNRIM